MNELRTLGTLDLRGPDGTRLDGLLKGPKRVALLTYLAVASPSGFHRRDRLLAMFWPECAERQARSSLRNTLHVLRRYVGPRVLVNRGAEEVGVAPGSLWCDAAVFRDECAAGRFDAAVELYRGELLPGLFVADAPEFEVWLSRERDTLQRTAFEAFWALATADEAAGNAAAASLRARRAAALCAFDEEAVRRLIRLLDRLGDRAGALSAYEQLCERLRADLDGEPSPETTALDQDIRQRPGTAVQAADQVTGPAQVELITSVGSAPMPGAAPGFTSLPAPPVLPSGRFRMAPALKRVAVLAAVLAIIGMAVVGPRLRDARVAADVRIVLAVGEVQPFGDADAVGLTQVLRDMLSTSLARSDVFRVISTGRVHELMNYMGGGASLAMAAREAGATELLEGTLVRTSGGTLRLDLRRVDLTTGELRAAYQVEGADPFVLVDRATAEMLAAHGVAPPASGLASVSTGSLLAYAFYEEGVRAYYDGDNRTAHRLLSAALADDSLFAMAAYYRAESRRTIDHAAFRDDLHRAARLSVRASERERLLITNAWAQAMDDPAQRGLAEALVARYPTEPEGHLFLGRARLWSGAFMDALPHLRRAVAMDSLALHAGSPRCLACDAIADVVSVYLLADSLPAAAREARAWTLRQPGSARAWRTLAVALEYQGQLAEAQAARRQSVRLGSDNPRDPLYPVVLALRDGEFQRADRLLAEIEAADASLVQQNVLWYRVLSLRYQGRLADALDAARQYAEMVRIAAATGHPPVWAAVLEAQVQLELGDARQAATLWRGMAADGYEPDSPSRTARHRAWTLTQAASAQAMAGDTVGLVLLADSIGAFGSQSAYGRDPLLHHYVRGLLLAARGDHEAAAATYRRAMFSTTSGYARINLELGRSLLALGQPLQAAEMLGAALRGPLDAANLYVSRTELHELAGHAWFEAGRSDMAAVHYQWVANAWIGSDPSLASRQLMVQHRLAGLRN